MGARKFDAKEETLANVMRDVVRSDFTEKTHQRVTALLDRISHIEFPIRVVRYAEKLGIMFDVEYYYLDNADGISQERVMDWWLNECDHNTLSSIPSRVAVEKFVRKRYGRLKDALNQADNDVVAFFTTSESFVEFRVFVPSTEILKSKTRVVDGVHDALSSLYSY